MSDAPFLKFFVGDYLAKTQHFPNAIYHGAYLLLIMASWMRKDGHLPDDDQLLASIANVGVRRWKKAIKPIVMDGDETFRKADDGRWYLPRVLDDQREVVALRDKRKAAGRLGGLKTQGNVQANAVQSESEKKKTPSPKKETAAPEDLAAKKEAPKEIQAEKVKGHKVVDGVLKITPLDMDRFNDPAYAKREAFILARVVKPSLVSMVGKLLKLNGDDPVHAYLVVRNSVQVGDPRSRMAAHINDARDVPLGKPSGPRRPGAIYAYKGAWYRVIKIDGSKDRKIIGYAKGA